MKKLIAFTLTAIFINSCSSASSPTTPGNLTTEKVEWNYEGEFGPSYWGDLSKAYESCGGKSQSPINIQTKKAVSEKLDDIKTDYKEIPLRLINNGHTVEVRYDEGSTLTVGGTTYKLLQFHFHTPSEHKVDDKSYPMEVHLVHQKEDGKLGVLGIFFKEGNENEFLKSIWNEIPESAGPEKQVENTKINVGDLLPENKEYFNYSGSLTTPGCDEIVNWMVLKTPVEASKEQIETFSELFHNNNARPVQAINDREVRVTA